MAGPDTFKRQVETAGEVDTRRVAASVAAELGMGLVYGLVGELGAGKTVFVKGAVEGLGGDPGAVRSPTFTLLNTYEAAQGLVHHFDLYRIETLEDLDSIGFFEFAREPGDVCMVEWADKVPGLEREIDVWVAIAVTPSGRTISISGRSGTPKQEDPKGGR